MRKIKLFFIFSANKCCKNELKSSIPNIMNGVRLAPQTYTYPLNHNHLED